MTYRVCKTFEIESGHMLSKHPDRCRFPHGHSRRIEIVLASETLDGNDMVCDFKTIRLALDDFLDRLDHSMAVNSNDPALANLQGIDERVIVFADTDPTTEVMAKYIYDFLHSEMTADKEYVSGRGNRYRFPKGLRIERVRVWETSSSWAEYTSK
ncbi:MAG TPA: 6-carboxytetrahydropterin synthase [Phycisphaeraceae bacterium]|nr:6-carboxytetrahydropterin synthase [Phycisphaeraceae bacterium]